jgi:hypothetical protein
MAQENGKPKVGRSARLLGVRPGIDVDVVKMPRNCLDDQGYLRSQAARESTGELVVVAMRSTRGMSTALSIESLPAFRKPASFGGMGRDPLWQIEDSQISGDLEAVQDSATHVSIMPRVSMLLERYEAALANTQNDWQKVS